MQKIDLERLLEREEVLANSEFMYLENLNNLGVAFLFRH